MMFVLNFDCSHSELLAAIMGSVQFQLKSVPSVRVGFLHG